MLLLLDLHAHGYTLAGIFVGLWLLPVGYLGYRSGLLPKVLSVLVLAASGASIIGTLLEFAFSDLPGVVTAKLAVEAVVEFWLVAYCSSRACAHPIAAYSRPRSSTPDASHHSACILPAHDQDVTGLVITNSETSSWDCRRSHANTGGSARADAKVVHADPPAGLQPRGAAPRHPTRPDPRGSLLRRDLPHTVDAHAVDGGYVFILVYGSRSDWVRNILAAGHARRTIDGRDIELAAPRLISGEEGWRTIGEDVKRPPGFLRIDEYLRMDLAAL